MLVASSQDLDGPGAHTSATLDAGGVTITIGDRAGESCSAFERTLEYHASTDARSMLDASGTRRRLAGIELLAMRYSDPDRPGERWCIAGMRDGLEAWHVYCAGP